MDESKTRDITLAVPIIAAIVGGICGAFGQSILSGRGDFITVREYSADAKRLDEERSAVEKEISGVDARLSRLEGLIGEGRHR